MAIASGAEPFSEKGFYLSEFRGRTLAIVARAGDLAPPQPLEALLRELEANRTRVVLFSTEAAALEKLVARSPIEAGEERFEGAVWRALKEAPHAPVRVKDGEGFPATCRELALRLGLSKLMWVDSQGGLRRPDGSRQSFVDVAELRRLLAQGPDAADAHRLPLLREIEMSLSAGIAAVNLASPEGLAEELFTYAGSGTLFTRERYMAVRRLGIDDYAAADHLIERGVAEGYLAPRPPDEIERILAAGFGAFVEGRHLAGIGALLDHPGVGEIASLYTLTRFLGEGVGGHLIRFALETARERRQRFVFACTTSDRVAGFFERHGFRRCTAGELPESKWRDYDSERRARVICLRHDTSA